VAGEPVAHGDLKISNLRFTEEGEGLCLLDLDTMGQLPLSVELGDAWRSWCNPAAEDSDETAFSLELFEASARAYLAESPQPAEVREQLGAGIERICLELAARFAADALEESYFGWSAEVAPSRGEHNLLRARGQLALASSVIRQRSAIEAILR
jgi:aminoglycoside phosphotransferase (APT) family kinase protein